MKVLPCRSVLHSPTRPDAGCISGKIRLSCSSPVWLPGFWRSVPDATGRCIFCHGGDRCRIPEYDALLPASRKDSRHRARSFPGTGKICCGYPRHLDCDRSPKHDLSHCSRTCLWSRRTMLFRTSSESKEIIRGKNLNSADPHRCHGHSTGSSAVCDLWRTLHRSWNQSHLRFLCRRNDLRI